MYDWQYFIYGTILRQYPPDVFAQFKHGSNLYSTTIAVLASAIQKISRVAIIPEGTIFYRGLSRRMELPDAFFRPDGMGRRGFAEWGFLSTTSNKDVALTYSYSGGGEADATAPIPIVIKISSSAVDRGASIHVFSQYPTVLPLSTPLLERLLLTARRRRSSSSSPPHELPPDPGR